VNSQARVALEVGTGCTVFVENTAGFTDHVVRPCAPDVMTTHLFGPVQTLVLCAPKQVWNPWRSNAFYPNFVCVENAVVGAPVQLESVRAPPPPLLGACVRRRSSAGRGWRASCCAPDKCVALCAQAAEWVGKSTLFVRDVVLSQSMLPADNDDAPLG
jgi:hypothetical protein